MSSIHPIGGRHPMDAKSKANKHIAEASPVVRNRLSPIDWTPQCFRLARHGLLVSKSSGSCVLCLPSDAMRPTMWRRNCLIGQ